MKDSDKILGQRSCVAQGIPEATCAGSRLTIRIEVNCDPPADLSGQQLRLEVGGGEPDAEALLQDSAEGSAYEAEISLTAPPSEGEHELILYMPEFDNGRTRCPELRHSFVITVVAHEIMPVIWGIPPAITTGEDFLARIGARCGAECATNGWIVRVRDHNGQLLAECETGNTVWKDTEGLYYAELSLTAPEAEGLFEWEACVEAKGCALPHKTGHRRFGLRTTARPDAILRVVAIDHEAGTALEGIKVVVHPFSALTDLEGVAEISLPGGQYRVFVSGKGYSTYYADCTIEGSETLRVELERAVVITEADVWA